VTRVGSAIGVAAAGRACFAQPAQSAGHLTLQYFVPQIAIVAPAADPAGGLPEKFGGSPWGLPMAMWPRCANCGKSQSFLAQLSHEGGRLDLGRAGRFLFLFQCAHDPGMCETWSATSGANACFVVEPENLTRAASVTPDDAPPLENEVWIEGWLARDDGVCDADAASFLDAESWFALEDDVLKSVTWSTRLGGGPRWLQSPQDGPGKGFRFVGQLDSVYSFLTPPHQALGWIDADAARFEGRSHAGAGPNFGDGGIAYIFLQLTADLPLGRLLWQCG